VIAVHYFASIREALDCELEKIELPANVRNVSDLIAHLVSTHGEKWADTLGNAQVLVAVNHEMSSRDTAVEAGDEVAFFPPVTGG